jgi:hypothetical protein
MQNSSPTALARTPLDDLPADRLADAMRLIWYMRTTRRPLYVAPGSVTKLVAEDLELTGLATMRRDDEFPGVMRVDLVRREVA